MRKYFTPFIGTLITMVFCSSCGNYTVDASNNTVVTQPQNNSNISKENNSSVSNDNNQLRKPEDASPQPARASKSY